MNLANEFKVISLRECLDPLSAAIVDGPKRADRYWRKHIATSPQFNPDVETAVVLMLNARLRAKGHTVIAVGTVDSGGHRAERHKNTEIVNVFKGKINRKNLVIMC